MIGVFVGSAGRDVGLANPPDLLVAYSRVEVSTWFMTKVVLYSRGESRLLAYDVLTHDHHHRTIPR